MLKEADTATPSTTGAASNPSGGFDPLGQDLKLFEVEVASFQAVAAPAQTSAQPAEPQAEPVGTAGAQARADQLPRTASPLPIAGLLALFSLGGAFGIRALRRR
jgi:hypothetical protein